MFLAVPIVKTSMVITTAAPAEDVIILNRTTSIANLDCCFVLMLALILNHSIAFIIVRHAIFVFMN
jgi:hypothetical protein